MAHILIVDDSMFSRHSLRRILEDAGHQVSEADSGLKAIEMVGQDPPDLVTLDLLMPGMRGEELLGHLKGMLPGARFVVISADVQESTQETLLAAGAHAFIPKPHHPEKTLEAIEKVLAGE